MEECRCARNIPGNGHKKYPHLLRGLEIECSNHVWSTDITYISLGDGHVYLTAVIDWSSRYGISWKLNNSWMLRSALNVWRTR